MRQVLEEIRLSREETNRRFEEMREENNRRFEAIDRRFEEMREETNRQFKETREEFRESIRQMGREISEKIDRLGSRWGIMAEDTLRAGFEAVLSDLGFKIEKWKKRDEKKEVFLSVRDVELDILIKDEKTIDMEMKSSLTLGEVNNFEQAVRFYEKVEGRVVDERLIVVIYPYPRVREYTQELGIRLVSRPDEIV